MVFKVLPINALLGQLDGSSCGTAVGYGNGGFACWFQLLAPGRDFIGAGRNVADGELAVCAGYSGVVAVDNDDKAGHFRVDITKKVDYARLVKNNCFGHAGVVCAQVELLADVCRENVVVDFVTVLEINGRTGRDGENMRDKNKVLLVNLAFFRGHRAFDALEVNDNIFFVLRNSSIDRTGYRAGTECV